MLDWWYDLPRALRAGFALLLLLISTLLFFFADTFWPWGWAVGAILLLFSGAGADKNGYNF